MIYFLTSEYFICYWVRIIMFEYKRTKYSSNVIVPPFLKLLYYCLSEWIYEFQSIYVYRYRVLSKLFSTSNHCTASRPHNFVSERQSHQKLWMPTLRTQVKLREAIKACSIKSNNENKWRWTRRGRGRGRHGGVGSRLTPYNRYTLLHTICTYLLLKSCNKYKIKHSFVTCVDR